MLFALLLCDISIIQNKSSDHNNCLFSPPVQPVPPLVPPAIRNLLDFFGVPYKCSATLSDKQFPNISFPHPSPSPPPSPPTLSPPPMSPPQAWLKRWRRDSCLWPVRVDRQRTVPHRDPRHRRSVSTADVCADRLCICVRRGRHGCCRLPSPRS